MASYHGFLSLASSPGLEGVRVRKRALSGEDSEDVPMELASEGARIPVLFDP